MQNVCDLKDIALTVMELQQKMGAPVLSTQCMAPQSLDPCTYVVTALTKSDVSLSQPCEKCMIEFYW